jgi:hypothetical protein
VRALLFGAVRAVSEESMLDPEDLIVKGTILALALLTAVRLVSIEISNVVSDFRKRWRRR